MMADTCAVSLSVELPRTVAAEVEQVQEQDPDFLRQVLLYGLTRRTIFERLAGRQRADES